MLYKYLYKYSYKKNYEIFINVGQGGQGSGVESSVLFILKGGQGCVNLLDSFSSLLMCYVRKHSFSSVLLNLITKIPHFI